MAVFWAIFLLFAVSGQSEGHFFGKKPNIIFIVADDLGWNDVGYNNPKMLTPNINYWAKKGVILDRSYVQSICSPSRSAFMTGYDPYRNGLNRFVIPWYSTYGLPKQFKLVPQYLQDQGYETHMLGKWHLGSCHTDYLPHNRGFDTYTGYLNAAEYNYNHSYPLTNNFIMRSQPGVPDVYDLFDKSTPLPEHNGTYTMEVLYRSLKTILQNRNQFKPQFLYIALPFAHCPVEYHKENEFWYHNVANPYRKGYSAFVTEMDSYFGKMMFEFEKYRIYQNSVVMFTTDNGGETKSGGNNYPLRGAKITLYEGGTRGVAFVTSPKLEKTCYRHNELIHTPDYAATMIELAGGTPDPNMDGVSFWDSVSKNTPSARTEFIYDLNINIFNTSKYDGAYRYGDWKLIFGDPRLPKTQIKPENVTGELYDACGGFLTIDPNAPEYQLYNVKDDPTESNDLAANMPEKVQELYERVKTIYIPKMVKSLYIPQNVDLYKNRTSDLTYLNLNWCTPIETVTPLFP